MNLSASEKALVTRLRQLPAAEQGAALDQAGLENPGLRGRRQAIIDAVATIPVTTLRSGSFSADSERYITTGNNGEARVWDVQTSQPVTEPMRHGPVRLPLGVLSPDGRFVRIETSTNVYLVWAVPPSQPPGTPTPGWLL